MKIFFNMIILLIFLVYAPVVSAIPFTTVESEDILVDWAYISPSSSSNEAQFVADYLGVDASTIEYTQFADSISSGESGVWLEVEGDGSDDLWAFDFGTLNSPYFLIKTGNHIGLDDAIDGGSSMTYTHYLYQNVASLEYGVINLNDFVSSNSRSIEIGIVSHVGSVPEPGTLLLLGSSLLGLGVCWKKFKK